MHCNCIALSRDASMDVLQERRMHCHFKSCEDAPLLIQHGMLLDMYLSACIRSRMQACVYAAHSACTCFAASCVYHADITSPRFCQGVFVCAETCDATPMLWVPAQPKTGRTHLGPASMSPAGFILTVSCRAPPPADDSV